VKTQTSLALAPSNDSARALDIRNLRKTYLSREGRVVQAITNVTISIGQGERLAVLGPSGCGKSTLLRILAGLDTQFGGEIVWDEQDKLDKTRLRSATVFQGDSTLPWMTVEKNIAIGMSGLALERQTVYARVKKYQDLVGLADFGNVYPHELSGGMRQRVAIARALATEPSLLLMDEPLAALDAQTRLVMQQELFWMWAQTNSTVVYVTHDIEEALSLADRLLIMTARPGRIKSLIDVPYDRSMEPMQRRRAPHFGEMQADIWAMVADEVGQTLQAKR
jgi:ABC-type nitrate/sulfonate/bicarbonate transport system ATPase subunit